MLHLQQKNKQQILSVAPESLQTIVNGTKVVRMRQCKRYVIRFS